MQATATQPSPTGPSLSAETVGNVGFKDWSVICDALGSGAQSLILRKGGIAEGRAGFRFKHERFFLMPTGFHQQLEKVIAERTGETPSPAFTDAETVTIRYFFLLEFAHWTEDWGQIAALRPFHIWREDVVRERFLYGDSHGLQCAFGRVYRCEADWSFPNRPSYGGCRSWVTLPEPPPTLHLAPVVDDATHAARRRDIGHVLGQEFTG